MKTLITLLLFSFFTLFSNAQDQDLGVKITVTIDNIANNDGNVLLALHTSQTFMKGQGIQNLSSKIKDGKIKVTFTNVPEGTYAIMALHDANENNRMDFEANGMPKESYGISNNDMSFGPPQFESAKFEVKNTDMSFSIRF